MVRLQPRALPCADPGPRPRLAGGTRPATPQGSGAAIYNDSCCCHAPALSKVMAFDSQDLAHAHLHPTAANPVPRQRFHRPLLPGWMTSADHRQVKALQASVVAHLRSQQLMAGLYKQIQPLDAFAKDRLGAAIQAKMDVTVDLETAVWQEQRLRVSTQPFNPIEGFCPGLRDPTGAATPVTEAVAKL